MTDLHAGRAELRRLALATMFPGFLGAATPPAWLRRLAAEGLGGVVLFGRNVDPSRGDAGVAELTAALREANPDLLVGIDEEGGDVTRLDVAAGSTLPGNAALGALDDPEASERVAAEIAARLRACGVHLNFAPVADVDSNPQNPVIGARSFGFDPDLVSRHVAAFVAGQQAQGVAATAKHFPGHGGTSEDSHLTVPSIHDSLEVIHQRDLPPFRAAVKADVKIVMTAHIRFPAIDGERPATLSGPVITGLLREELGYDGLVMTDGMDMHAISRTVGHPEGAVLALLAGVDALCVGGDTVGPETLEAMASALVEAVESGRLPEQRLAEAAGRVASLRRWLAGVTPVPVAAGAATGAARRAVTTAGDLRLEAPPLVLQLEDEPSMAAGPIPWGVAEHLAARVPGTVVVRLTEAGPDLAGVLAEHPDRRVVVGVRGVRRRPWQVGLVAAARELRPDLVVVDHDVNPVADVLGEHHVLTYGAARVTAEAAADILASHSGVSEPGSAT
ncbi:glycoside hydrolase family 3 protein [Jiangella asiatica]|uniref:Glycoside hydrolase family 3 protein n=1 Tax=Jiangella asiatica TaxID=2530372 RepID=A0A4R5DTS9_9ACTN|nr:glycoside hydrolase family 3 protein [Jiangella asiatica]TDE15834.1 glycoside hydrolase family 3 protein [Jiangella asiatica]